MIRFPVERARKPARYYLERFEAAERRGEIPKCSAHALFARVADELRRNNPALGHDE